MFQQNQPKTSEMMDAFAKMTPEQREYVYSHVKHIIPGADIAFRAAINRERYRNAFGEKD